MSDKQYAQGVFITATETIYGELLNVGINVAEFAENPMNEKGFINFTIKRAKETNKPYAELRDKT